MKRLLSKIVFSPLRRPAKVCGALVVALAATGGACFTSDDGEAFYGRVVVPRAQEFRWSDGGLPRIFDPARAAAPPDTDAVRALYEGLTDYDPQTLRPVSAEAYRWESSKDNRVWTFYLRPEARWSNGDPVTAQDYLNSWQRALRLGEGAPHVALMRNLLAAKEREPEAQHESATEPTARDQSPKEPSTSEQAVRVEAPPKPERESAEGAEANRKNGAADKALAVEAVEDHVLRVRLQRPDPDLPSLLAHPVFRPVHASLIAAENESAASELIPDANGKARTTVQPIISNGAFRLAEASDQRVVLERGASYWNASHVALDKVRFVGTRDAEAALGAYRDGEVDAVTNANIEPAGLKLLASYKDFRRTTYGALTYYDFNSTRPPFDDPRVRQALALAIDRKRLSDDTLGGSTVPAEEFLPPASESGDDDARALKYDPTRARRLLAEAGYPGGYGFPKVRLLVNRNDQHRQVAESVAEMWKTVLGVETEIELKGWDEYETKLRAGEYDLAKRSALMQTPDEQQNLLAMFSPDRFAFDSGDINGAARRGAVSPPPSDAARRGENQTAKAAHAAEVLTQSQALRDIPAIPIYFASSFALVKPYVNGLDANMLDAYSLQRVRIDTGWQLPKPQSNVVIGVGR
ncbi:MAG: peptide ABC transporter substrate-binding protein [Pyrinomonadaceae bacterium]